MNRTLLEKQIEKAIIGWEKNEINNKFRIKGFSIFWFYNTYLLGSNLPHPFSSLSRIKEDFINKKSKSVKEWILIKLFSTVFRKALRLNTLLKIYISRTKNKEAAGTKNNVLSLVYTNHILFKGNSMKIFRLNNVLELIDKDRTLNNFSLVADPLTRFSFGKLKRLKNTVYQFIEKEDINRAKRISKELSRKWKEVPIQSKRDSLLTPKGSLWPYLRHHLNFFYSEDMIFQVILFYNAFKKIILENNVNSVVLTSENGFFEKCAIAAAKECDVPSIVIQHGFGLGSLFIEKDIPANFAIFGEEHKKRLLGLGINPKNIHITGPVVFDDLIKFKNGASAKNDTIILATDPFVEENILTKKVYFARIKKILRDLQKSGEFNILIKLHPAEKLISEYKKIVKKEKYGNVTIYGGEYTGKDFYKLISQSSIFINFGSQSSLEAVLLGKPVLTVNLLDSKLMIDWIEKAKISVCVPYNKNIWSALKKALKNKNLFKKRAIKYIQKIYKGVDGRASERVVELIHALIDEAAIQK